MNSEIIILLSTFNGEKYIKQQLDSLLSQSFKDFNIIARDDGSSDKTIEILKLYNIRIINSTGNIGAKKSFSEILKYAIKNTDANYFMFCDQDDIWEENKIEKSYREIKRIEIKNINTPLLIHTDLKVVDKNICIINKSFWNHEFIIPKHNSFNRLIMQNTITGCTMIINRLLAEKSINIPNEAIMHDWWIGLIASKFGKIYYISDTTIKYRQHINNTIGAKGFQKNISNITTNLIKNKNVIDLTPNIAQAKCFLELFSESLSQNDQEVLKKIIEIKNKKYWSKRIFIWKYKLLKQGFIRNIGLFLKI